MQNAIEKYRSAGRQAAQAQNEHDSVRYHAIARDKNAMLRTEQADDVLEAQRAYADAFRFHRNTKRA